MPQILLMASSVSLATVLDMVTPLELKICVTFALSAEGTASQLHEEGCARGGSVPHDQCSMQSCLYRRNMICYGGLCFFVPSGAPSALRIRWEKSSVTSDACAAALIAYSCLTTEYGASLENRPSS